MPNFLAKVSGFAYNNRMSTIETINIDVYPWAVPTAEQRAWFDGLSAEAKRKLILDAIEEGFDINCASLSAFEFPKGTPEAIVNRLAEATNKVVESAFVRERFATLGIAVEPLERRTREYYARSLPPEVERQAVVMKANGLTAD